MWFWDTQTMFGHSHHVAVFFSDPDVDQFVVATTQSTESGVSLDVLHEAFEDGVTRVKNLHRSHAIGCRRVENVCLFAPSNGPIESVNVSLLHEFVDGKKCSLIENLVKYTSIHPLKFASA
jgi:hypothetical protein